MSSERRSVGIAGAMLLLPLLSYTLAVLCGRTGIPGGRIFEFVFLWAWPFVFLYCCIRCVQVVCDRRNRLVYSVCALASLGGIAWSLNVAPFLENFERGLQQRMDAARLQQWAVRELKVRGSLRVLSQSEYPQWATDGFSRPHSIGIFPSEGGSSSSYVKITWGNMLIGSWGLIVGTNDLERQGRMWRPGVYFFAHPKPLAWRN